MRVKTRNLLMRLSRTLLAILLLITLVMSYVPQAVQAKERTLVDALYQADSQNETKQKSVTVKTQSELNKALADQSITKITIKTSAEKKLTIPNKAYKTKTLVVYGPKLTLSNSGRFKEVIISDVKALTENAKGNHITINDNKLTVTISSKGAPKRITTAKMGTSLVLTINGSLEQLVILEKVNLTLKGKTANKIRLWIKDTAENTQITSYLLVNISSATAAKIILRKGAEKSIITLTNDSYSITVVNKTSKSIRLNTTKGRDSVEAGETRTTKVKLGPTQIPEEENKEDIPTPTVQPEVSEPGNSSGGTINYYTITFESNGGTYVNPLRVVSGENLNTLPIPHKSNSIFLGWYTDSSYQDKFTQETPVYSNITLYAKYSEIETEQQVLDDSYSIIDQSPFLSFTIISTDSTITADSVKNAFTLESTDGSEAVDITVTGGSGTYLLTALQGFTEGASYRLTLTDARLNFQEKESNIRKCYFTIIKEEVYNISLNDNIIYIPSGEVTKMTKNGANVQQLSVAVVSMGSESSEDNAVSGTFIHQGTQVLEVGDVLCVYSEELPQAPGAGGDDSQYMDDSIAYIVVDSVTGTVGNQTVYYSDAEADEVIFVPDMLPIYSGDGNKLLSYYPVIGESNGALQIDSSNLNFDTFTDLGLSSETTVDEGDFIALYTDDFTSVDNSDTVSYGEVTNVVEDNGVLAISYQSVNEEQMQEVLDYYSINDVDSDMLLDGIDVAAIEKDIEEQVMRSGFAEDASIYLTALAMKTDGFKTIAGDDLILETMSIQLPDSYEQDVDAIYIMSKSSKVKIENLKVTPKISKSLQKLSGSGIRCEVAISFDVPVEIGEDKQILISFTATFVEEVKLSVNASGKAVWKKKWIFPYIADYKMNANIDVYNYTGVRFKSVISSKETGTTDISEEIQKLLSSDKEEQISTGVQELFEIYDEMMDHDSDWLDIYEKNIIKSDMRLLLGVIHIRTTIDFVVSANVNAAVGCNFEYQDGIRYSFWAKIGSKEAESDRTSLMTKKYNFQFYSVGVLGLRAGIRIEFAVGLFSVNSNSIGLIAEVGIYTKLYGYFFYQLEAANKAKDSKMSGVMYLECGIYLDISFKAQVLNGKYQYNPTLYKNEWPLLSAGKRYNAYDFAYDKTKRNIKMKVSKYYTLPDSMFNMVHLDLREGDISTKSYDISDFDITFSNPNFTMSGNRVRVDVPTGIHELNCDMTITYKGAPLAFSCVPISRTYYLDWDDINENGYSISYETNGGSQILSVTKKYKEEIYAPDIPVKTGYTFEDWYSDEKLTKKYSFTTMPANNLILYAKWTPNSDTLYRVEHYQQNLLNDDYTRYAVDTMVGTTDSLVAAVAKDFTGFTYDNTIKGSVFREVIKADGSLVLRLYYRRNSYWLIFNQYNGKPDIKRLEKYGATISAPSIVQDGYTFQGWDKTVSDTMPAATTTYTAIWTPSNYTIRYNTNGGSSISNVTQAYGTVVVEPVPPTKEGSIFIGWYCDEDLTMPYTHITMPATNITLYARWGAMLEYDYKVEHYHQVGYGYEYMLMETENCKGYLDTVVYAKAKEYTGFTYNNSGNDTVSSGTVVEDGSLVLKLYYDRKSYTLTFILENGEYDIVEVHKYGMPITEPTVTRDGYNFIGWDRPVDATMPAADTTYIAQWELIIP